MCANSSDTDDEPGSVLAAIVDGSSTSWRGGADEVDERLAEEAGLVADGFVRYDAQAVMDASAVTQRCPLSVRVLLSSIDDDESGGGDGGEV